MPKLVPPLHTPIAGTELVAADVWQRYFVNLYQEGTWTPVLGGAGGTAGQTYAHQVGRWVKVGRLVVAMGQVQLSAKGTLSGPAAVLGLPFRSAEMANTSWVATLSGWTLATPWASVTGLLPPSTRTVPSTTVSLMGVPAAGATGPQALTAADLANTSALVLNITYLAQE